MHWWHEVCALRTMWCLVLVCGAVVAIVTVLDVSSGHDTITMLREQRLSTSKAAAQTTSHDANILPALSSAQSIFHCAKLHTWEPAVAVRSDNNTIYSGPAEDIWDREATLSSRKREFDYGWVEPARAEMEATQVEARLREAKCELVRQEEAATATPFSRYNLSTLCEQLPAMVQVWPCVSSKYGFVCEQCEYRLWVGTHSSWLLGPSH